MQESTLQSLEVTLIYKIKAKDLIYRPDKIYYNKYSDCFSFIVPALGSIAFTDNFILYINDTIAEKSSIEYCEVVDKKFSNNKCKVSFDVKSKGTYFLQETIQNVDYWED